MISSQDPYYKPMLKETYITTVYIALKYGEKTGGHLMLAAQQTPEQLYPQDLYTWQTLETAASHWGEERSEWVWGDRTQNQ
jgi:hypothetical protein